MIAQRNSETGAALQIKLKSRYEQRRGNRQKTHRNSPALPASLSRRV